MEYLFELIHSERGSNPFQEECQTTFNMQNVSYSFSPTSINIVSLSKESCVVTLLVVQWLCCLLVFFFLFFSWYKTTSLWGISLFSSLGVPQFHLQVFSPKPKFQFISYSRFNTCENILWLPLQRIHYTSFKEDMDFAIHNSPGFGGA